MMWYNGPGSHNLMKKNKDFLKLWSVSVITFMSEPELGHSAFYCHMG